MIELLSPEFLIAVEPIVGVAHGFRPQAAAYDAAILLASDEPGVRQDVEMFHDRGQRHRKGLREFAHRKALAAAEPRHQRPPGWIGESRKGAVQPVFSILNHVV